MSYRKPAALALNFIKLAEQNASGIQHKTLSLVKHRCIVEAGFPYESFDARAKVQPRSLLKLLECVGITSWWTLGPRDSFMHMSSLDIAPFVVSTAFHFKPEFYDTQVEKRPITVDMILDYLGKTSFHYKNHLFFPAHEKPLIEANLQFVFIDPKTRRSASPPDWWMEKYQSEVSSEGKPLLVPSIAVPSKADIAEQDIVVRLSDVDSYMHLNAGNYMKFCVDCHIQWHMRKYGLFGNGDPFRTIKSLVIKFKGEGRVGDLLKVKFWQSEENQDLFHFLIFKGSSVISECSIEFYPLEF